MKHYNDDGTPVHVRCFNYKRAASHKEKYTVLFTKLSTLGHVRYLVTGIGMSADPAGYSVRFEGVGNEMKASFGTRIKFSDLPEACQKLIQREYETLWSKNPS